MNDSWWQGWMIDSWWQGHLHWLSFAKPTADVSWLTIKPTRGECSDFHIWSWDSHQIYCNKQKQISSGFTRGLLRCYRSLKNGIIVVVTNFSAIVSQCIKYVFTSSPWLFHQATVLLVDKNIKKHIIWLVSCYSALHGCMVPGGGGGGPPKFGGVGLGRGRAPFSKYFSTKRGPKFFKFP